MRHWKTILCLMSFQENWTKHLGSSIICSSKLCHNQQNKWILKLLFSLRVILVSSSHIFSESERTYSFNFLKSECSSSGIVVYCLQYSYSNEILKWFVKHHANIKLWCWCQVFFQLEIELYCEKGLCTHFDDISGGWS